MDCIGTTMGEERRRAGVPSEGGVFDGDTMSNVCSGAKGRAKGFHFGYMMVTKGGQNIGHVSTNRIQGVGDGFLHRWS